MWSYPTSVQLKNRSLTIKNKCDYRVVLDVIRILNDSDLLDRDKYDCVFHRFFVEKPHPDEYEEALIAVYDVISTTYGDDFSRHTASSENTPSVMSWEKDFRYIAPPISRVLGYDVRDPDRFTHWYSFTGAYMEIGACFFSEVVALRKKLAYNEPLDENDRKFYQQNYDIVNMDEGTPLEDDEYLKGGI